MTPDDAPATTAGEPERTPVEFEPVIAEPESVPAVELPPRTAVPKPAKVANAPTVRSAPKPPSVKPALPAEVVVPESKPAPPPVAKEPEPEAKPLLPRAVQAPEPRTKSVEEAAARPAQPAELALAEQPALPAPQVSLEALPLSIGSWTLERGLDPVSGRDRCYVASARGHMEDGQGGTPVTLFLTQDSLRVATRSHIDPSYSGTGLQVDDDAVIPLGEVFKHDSIVFTGGIDRIHRRFTRGHKVHLLIGFWPTWPVTHPYEATFPLSGYDRALAALRKCDAL